MEVLIDAVKNTIVKVFPMSLQNEDMDFSAKIYTNLTSYDQIYQ